MIYKKHKKYIFLSGSRGKVTWTGNWVSYIDTLLQFELISIKTRELRLPTYIKEIIIDPVYHKQVAERSSNPNGSTKLYALVFFGLIIIELCLDIEVNHYGYAKTTQSGGVTISKLKVTPAPLKKNAQLPATLERHSFIPYTYTVSI